MAKEVIIYCGDDKEYWTVVPPIQYRILNNYPELKKEDVNVFKISKFPDENEPTEDEKALFASLGPDDRITIISHCSPNATTANKTVHYSQLARYLEKRLDKNKVHDPQNNKSIKISLVMCNAGRGRSNNKKSFASQFPIF